DRAGESVRFSVSDSGPGISAEDQHRLFEPFAQLGDLSQRVGGTGLGLNVSRSILEQMGSRLMVESQTGWGTRFWFDLALPEAAGASLKSRPAARRITGYDGPRLRVLVADDHAPNRAVLVDLLEPIGFTVATALDGQEAIDAVRQQKPDLIFLDLRMPRVDGLAAARAIRELFPDDPPCLIGISASAHEVQRQSALAAGCVAFLAKPFRDEELFSIVERHLGLVWRYSDALPSPESAVPFPILPCPPSPEAAATIYDLACKGDVMGVRNYVQQLAAKDTGLAPFAQNIIDLAGRFKMKAIRSYVARYRDAAPAATPPPAEG
ncbi:MAG TPA: response regulator, partial [Candidatus Didemnitutus sp.]|nr:response regulator [Candidatus Didemnitutus sp.]